ncbi:efflux RND transporter permease subunit [soil metagenome]
MSLARFAVHAPVKVTMIFVAVILLGWISLRRLPTNLFPDIQTPKVTVTIKTKGLSPVEVERRICEVIERSLYSIRGVVGVQSISRADDAVVVVTFNWETRLDYAFIEVKKAASDLQRDRPDDVDSVNVLRYDPNATPIMTVALQAPESADLESVYRAADQTLKPRFERLEGVASVVLTGGMEREILIDVDEALLLSYDLQVSSIVSALQADNVDASGGWVEEGARRYLLKAVGKFESEDEVSRVVVGRKGDAPILISDVATVRLTPKEATSVVYFDGKPAVGMAFYRDAESNTVAVAESIRKEIEDAKKVIPSTWKIGIANDQSLFIKAAILEVRNDAFAGGILAVIVLFLFLRDFRTTMIIAIAIPLAIIANFNLMYFQGLSLNMMTLGGLALSSGMIVDNAIVVLENVFRLRQLGYSNRDAAQEGTRQVTAALIASTLTTVAVFLPIVYVKGVVALLFREQALTVSYSQLTSLLIALLLLPMMCAYMLGSGGAKALHIEETFTVPKNLYTRTLAVALRHRVAVTIGSAVLLAMTAFLFMRVPQEFFPSTRVNQVGIRLVLPTGTPIAATDSTVQAVTQQLDRYGASVSSVFARVGEPEGVVNANLEDPDGPNTADIFVTLRRSDTPTTATIAAEYRDLDSTKFVAGMKPILANIQDAKVEFNVSQGSLMELIGSAGAPLVVEISGPEIETLTRMATQVRDRIEPLPALLNVRTNILDGAPEVLLKLDRTQLARYGLDVNAVATILRQRIDGEVATQIKREAGDVDLRVQVAYGREDLETLRNITFKTSAGAIVRLASIADFNVVRGPREIVRRKQERVAYVMADLAPGIKLSQAITQAQGAIRDVETPGRYAIRFTGEEEQRRESFVDLKFAFILSIALVYMVMASIFESFLQPFLILTSIPLAGIGVVISLLVTHQTINVMSIIGIVLLGGIVVNNAIVLLDCVNQVRDAAKSEGASLTERETLILGCNRRLRPVIMTTGTTLLGVLPMALGLGDGAELRQAMAVTVLGGLFSSTLLTLYVIPCGQSYLDSMFRKLRGKKDAAHG